jgi:hypothetical protein
VFAITLLVRSWQVTVAEQHGRRIPAIPPALCSALFRC